MRPIRVINLETVTRDELSALTRDGFDTDYEWDRRMLTGTTWSPDIIAERLSAGMPMHVRHALGIQP